MYSSPKICKNIKYYKKLENYNNCKKLYYLYLNKCKNKKNILCKRMVVQIEEYYKCDMKK